MNNIFQAYIETVGKDIISEAENIDEIELNDIENVNIAPEQKQKDEQQVEKQVEKTEKVNNAEETDMKFSVDLATEFSNTVNEFTTVCSKIVEKRIIDKDTSDKFYDLYSKIKNLADAAAKTY